MHLTLILKGECAMIGETVPGQGRANFGQAGGSSASMKWAALHEAEAIVSMLAGKPQAPSEPAVRNFPAQIRNLDAARKDAAEQGIHDLAAIMEPGLAALLAVNARGVDPQPAARSLWDEFHAARSAILSLAPAGSMGPQRSA